MVQLEELVMILDLHRQGLSVTAIARQLNLDRKTVRKYTARGLKPPAYKPRSPREHHLDPFTDYLRERVAAYPALTGSRLLSGELRNWFFRRFSADGGRRSVWFVGRFLVRLTQREGRAAGAG